MSTTQPLNGKVIPAPPGLKGFDTNTIVTAEVAQQFKAQGYSFCARYLSRGTSQGSNDLSSAEAATILTAGLALIAVQHVAAAGWVPSASLGTTNGTNAANNAISVGLPIGMNIWCDLEGVDTGTASSVVIDYCQAWYKAVAAAGYVPGLYVGANCVLTGQKLYSNLSYQHYWKSMSNVPMVATRGYQLVQGAETTVNGIGIDSDTTQNDNLGGTVIWLAPLMQPNPQFA